MKAILFVLLLVACVMAFLPAASPAADSVPRYAVATVATPVLNTPDFKKYFSGSIALDPCKGVRPIEFVALPGTLFRVQAELEKDGVPVYRVTTNDYPYPSTTGYFVDARFVKLMAPPVAERPRRLPGLDEIRQRLVATLGKPYVWGGNVKDGLPQLLKYYPQADTLSGVDCSGLLYQAADGFTPRNTSALTSFGKPVAVAGLSAEQIAEQLQPLDLIVWKGHVMIVLDKDSFIESTMGCEGGGGSVHLTPLRSGLRHLMKRRQPADAFPKGAAAAKAFVVRRWFGR